MERNRDRGSERNNSNKILNGFGSNLIRIGISFDLVSIFTFFDRFSLNNTEKHSLERYLIENIWILKLKYKLKVSLYNELDAFFCMDDNDLISICNLDTLTTKAERHGIHQLNLRNYNKEITTIVSVGNIDLGYSNKELIHNIIINNYHILRRFEKLDLSSVNTFGNITIYKIQSDIYLVNKNILQESNKVDLKAYDKFFGSLSEDEINSFRRRNAIEN